MHERTPASPQDDKSRWFQQIVLPHLDAAYNLAAWLTRQPADAEDVVQEAMLRALRFADGCREATAKSWLLRIVRNVAYDRLTASGGLALFADLNPDDPDGSGFTTDAFGGTTEDPESRLLKDQDRRQLDRLIALLPLPYREVLVLRELEELSYKEIAEVAAIPIGTVMSRLARARDWLHKAWSERNG